VNYSPGFKWFVLLLLPLTLIGKLAAGSDRSVGLKDDLIAFLVRQQFEIQVLDDSMPIIRATSNHCKMEIAAVSPDGWHDDLMRTRADAADHVFTVFRGTVYVDQPTWLTAAYALLSKPLQRLKLLSYPAPVIRVIAQDSCKAELLPWRKLYEAGVL
jgi:hypothetical protein